MNDTYGLDICRAVQDDARLRELQRYFGPTAQERIEQERRERAFAFEHGDHQPDGTIGPAPGKYPYRLPDNPVMQGQGVICGADYAAQGTAAHEAALGTHSEPVKIDLPRPAVPSPAIQAAMEQMEHRLLQQQQFGHLKLRDMNSDGEVLVLQIPVVMSAKDAQQVRDMHAKRPELMAMVLGQMQREAVYEMRSKFGINAHGME